MRRIKYNKWLLMCLLLIPLFSNAQYSETREFERRFQVEEGTQIEISNKYGAVEVNTWDKDSVYLKIKIEVEEKRQDKLEKTLENIDFDFTNSQYYLIAKTIFGENRSQLESELIRFKESLLQTGGNVSIDYVVWLPDHHRLVIDNKFGDILMGDYSGDVNINLSNGKLRAKEIKSKLTLDLNFADAILNNVQSARITSNYSDIYIKDSKQLRFDSKSSTVEILHTSNVEADSRRDKFRVRMVDSLEIDANFSSLRIGNLKNNAKLRTTYGDIEMENINPKYKNIYLDSHLTDINLYFSSSSSFNFEITEARSDLDFCREVKVKETVELDPKNHKNRHTCTFGEKASGDEKLIIDTVSGDVNIFSY